MINIKICILLFCFCGHVTSQANGYYFQEPSIKWAVAQSYSWVIGPSGPTSSGTTYSGSPSGGTTSSGPTSSGPTFSRPTSSRPTSSEQISSAPISSAPISSAPISNAPISSAPISSEPIASAPISSEPIFSEPISSKPISKYRDNYETVAQQARRQTPLQFEIDTQQLRTQMNDQQNQINFEPHSIRRPYGETNEFKGTPEVQSKFSTEPVTSSSLTPNTVSSPYLLNHQNFIDDIVSKVIQKTKKLNSNYGLPPTKQDIERIVREILLEHAIYRRGETNSIESLPTYPGYSNVLDNNQRSNSINQNNRILLPQLAQVNNPPNVKYYNHNLNPNESNLNTQTECIVNCVGTNPSYVGQPIAVAAANAFYPGFSNRPLDARMAANTFTYTSV